jgi:hypothetical protein
MSLSDWNTPIESEDSGTSFHLYALGAAYSDTDVNASAERTTDPDAVFYVKLSDMRAVFQFRRGTGTTGTDTVAAVFDASSDIRYYVFRKYWPTALNLNPSHAMLDRDESTGMLIPGGAGAGAFSADKSLVKHDFIRYIALHLFNTIHGVDLFRNEEDLRENLAYYGEVARVGIMSVLDTVGTMSANITMSVDSSGNRYSTNEDTTVTNISRELMRQISVSAPGRLRAIDDAEGGGGAGTQSIPLSENDTLNFKVVMEASPGQNALTNVAAIPARTYNIKLIMKSSVAGGGGGGGAYTNTAATDCVSFPNGYPYAENVYDISASNASTASSVYADGSPPVPIPLLRYGYQGWYYTNSDAWVNPAPSVRNKINWYLLPNSATSTVGDLRYVRLNLHVFSRVSTPFLTVDPKATGVGDAGGWYKSKRVYVVANAAAALSNNTNYCFYINWNGYSVAPFTVAHNNVALSLTTVGSGAVGAFGSGEVLFAYSIGTDSGSARGNVEFILSGAVVGEGSGGGTEKEYGYIPV